MRDRLMQLIVECPDGCPFTTKPQRKTVATLDFATRGSGLLACSELKRTAVKVGENATMFVEGSYTPVNHVLSLRIGYSSSSEEEVAVFGAVTESHGVPGCFTLRLPDGKFIELCIQPDTPGEH